MSLVTWSEWETCSSSSDRVEHGPESSSTTGANKIKGICEILYQIPLTVLWKIIQYW